MSIQTDSELSGSQPPAMRVGFAGKPLSSHGPKTVVNPERRAVLPTESRHLSPTAIAKRRRLFPSDDLGSSVESLADDIEYGPGGVQLAHFVVEMPIGRGGMGAVYRAIDQSLQRVVALKILSPDQTQTSNAVQRFINEARASAQLDHDNIARVYFVGEDEGLHFIAYEYVTGTNIRDLINQQGRLDPAEAIHFALQIAAALKHTSAAGVVHRDVKPSNIIVTPVGRAKLVDLGLARKEYSESVDELTVAGTTLGTFDYISPEQAKDPRNVDVRSDIYSLGCTLYQMLTGEPPYPEGTMYQKLLKHDSQEPPDPARKNKRVPAQLSTVVRKMMASDPARRHRNADELIRDLMNIAGQLGVRTVSPDGLVWSAEMTKRPPGFLRRNLGWMATAAALLLIVFLLDRFGSNLKSGVDSLGINGAGQVAAPVDDGDGGFTPKVAVADITSPGVQPLPSATDGGPTTDESSQETRLPADDSGPPPIQPQPIRTPEKSQDTTSTDTNASTTKTPGDDQTESKTPTDVTAGTSNADSRVPETTEGPNTVTPSESFPPVDVDQPRITLLAAGGAEPKAFNTLESACHAATDGSVIVLRYNGTRPDIEKPLRLNDKRITIRGAKGFRPLIHFLPAEDSAGEMPTRLITLIGGFKTSVELINVDLRVTLPENVNPGLDWALFSLQGAEQVRLKDVHITFENVEGRSPASLIELTSGPDANLVNMKMMKEKPAGARTQFDIKISDSFVHGGCDLFHVKHTQPGRFAVEQSVVAVDGTLLSIFGDLEMPAENAKLELDLEHVTTLLGNGLVRWNTGSDPRDVLPVHVTSRNNIFSTNAGRPLIAMEGNTDPDDFRKLLRWSGEHNFYDRFTNIWIISSDLDPADSSQFDFDRWKSHWGAATELNPHGAPIIWKTPWWEKDFAELTIDALQLDLEAIGNPAVGGALNGSDVGADLTTLRTTVPVAPATEPAEDAADSRE